MSWHSLRCHSPNFLYFFTSPWVRYVHHPSSFTTHTSPSPTPSPSTSPFPTPLPSEDLSLPTSWLDVHTCLPSHQRLKEHYDRTLRTDLMYVLYNHLDPAHPIPFEVPMHIPGLNARNQAYKKNMVPVPVNPKVKPLPPPPPRSHQNIPELLSIRVSTTLPDSSRSKHLLLNAFSQLEFITGHYPTLLRADQANVLLGLRKGMPWGAEVVLTQDDMYMFLDKLVEWVFPRLKNWYGIPLHTGTSSSSSSTPIPQGELHLNFDPWVTSYFPEIEQTYDRFTQMCPLHVIFKTSACSDWETRMLLSGFQIPMEDHVSKSKREKYNLKPTSEDLDEPEWMKFKRAREELMDKKNEK